MSFRKRKPACSSSYVESQLLYTSITSMVVGSIVMDVFYNFNTFFLVYKFSILNLKKNREHIQAMACCVTVYRIHSYQGFIMYKGQKFSLLPLEVSLPPFDLLQLRHIAVNADAFNIQIPQKNEVILAVQIIQPLKPALCSTCGTSMKHCYGAVHGSHLNLRRIFR